MASLGTLPLWLNVMLKCLCLAHRETIWPCSPVNDCKKAEINTSPPGAWPFQEMFCKTDSRFFFFFSFTSSLPFSPSLCSMKETGIKTLIRWLFWDISLPSSWSASFLNKVLAWPLTRPLNYNIVCRLVGLLGGELSEHACGNSTLLTWWPGLPPRNFPAVAPSLLLPPLCAHCSQPSSSWSTLWTPLSGP